MDIFVDAESCNNFMAMIAIILLFLMLSIGWYVIFTMKEDKDNTKINTDVTCETFSMLPVINAFDRMWDRQITYEDIKVLKWAYFLAKKHNARKLASDLNDIIKKNSNV